MTILKGLGRGKFSLLEDNGLAIDWGIKYVIRLHWLLVLTVCGVMMADSNSIVERPSFLPSASRNCRRKPCTQASHCEIKACPFFEFASSHMLNFVFSPIENVHIDEEKEKAPC